MDYQLLLFLRIALVAVLYLAVLQIVFVAQREMRQDAKAVARGGAPSRAPRVVGHLVVLDKGSTQLRDGEIYDIEEVTTLGREPTSSIPMDSGFVSAAHARIIYDAQDSTLWVEDMDSRNGTYLDGRKVQGRVAVAPGSILQIGDTRFKFQA
jgi:hypothetical protein